MTAEKSGKSLLGDSGSVEVREESSILVMLSNVFDIIIRNMDIV